MNVSTSLHKGGEIYNLTEENERLIQEINRLTTKLHKPPVSNEKSLFKEIIKSSTKFSLKDTLKVDDKLWRREDPKEGAEIPNVKTSFVSRLSSSTHQFIQQEKKKQCNTREAGGDRNSCPKLSMCHQKPHDSSTTFSSIRRPFEGSNCTIDSKQITGAVSKNAVLHQQQKQNEREAADFISKEKLRESERLIGEIAFQLDKRILHSIFSHRKRLYGFSVRNITEKIDEYTRDSRTGAVDIEKRESLRAKRDSTMLFLSRAAGYNPKHHSAFAEMLINKYGVLRVNKGKSERDHRVIMNEEYLKSTIVSTVDTETTYDALTLLNSLLAFAKLDGKPLFLW